VGDTVSAGGWVGVDCDLHDATETMLGDVAVAVNAKDERYAG